MSSEVYFLYLTPYYDTHKQTYYNIVVIDRNPVNNSALKSIVERTTFTKLSPFKGFYDNNYCMYAIKSFSNYYKFSIDKDLPIIFQWLIINGYTINTDITNMINNNNIFNKSKKLICFITK